MHKHCRMVENPFENSCQSKFDRHHGRCSWKLAPLKSQIAGVGLLTEFANLDNRRQLFRFNFKFASNRTVQVQKSLKILQVSTWNCSMGTHGPLTPWIREPYLNNTAYLRKCQNTHQEYFQYRKWSFWNLQFTKCFSFWWPFIVDSHSHITNAITKSAKMSFHMNFQTKWFIFRTKLFILWAVTFHLELLFFFYVH